LHLPREHLGIEDDLRAASELGMRWHCHSEQTDQHGLDREEPRGVFYKIH
jgi:hypothetical protein